MALRLGFHYHVPAISAKDGIYMPGYLGLFIDGLAQCCEELVCFQHSPTASEKELLDYQITSPNVTLVDIGPHVSVPQRMLFFRRYTSHLQDWRKRLDALLIRGPSPLLPAMARAAADTPVALLLVGDYLAGIPDLLQPRWRKEAIRLWATWNKRQQDGVARHGLTFVNSRKLFEELSEVVPDIIETRTTTLSATDFFNREDTCISRPCHLLYTGRMDRAKGLFEMVEALADLVSQGEDVVLNLVGWITKGDTIIDELHALARERGVAERVKYHGYKAVGPELFAWYKRADVYVLASKSSFEGFPRTIWEAMAHSLPVVATKVGSIPYFLQDGETALLVSPRNTKELSGAIGRIIRDAPLRRKLIKKGMELSHENTLETRSTEMVAHIERWLAERKE